MNCRHAIETLRVVIAGLYQLLEIKGEVELGADILLRVELNVAPETLHNFVADDQAKADSLRIDARPLVLDAAELFEQLVLVFLFDSNALVDHSKPHLVWPAIVVCLQSDGSFAFRELDSI